MWWLCIFDRGFNEQEIEKKKVWNNKGTEILSVLKLGFLIIASLKYMQKEQGAHYMVVESWLVKKMLDPTGSFSSPPVCVCVHRVCVWFSNICVCVCDSPPSVSVCVYCHRFHYRSPSVLWVLNSHTCLPTNYRMFCSNKDTFIVLVHFKDFFFFC